MDKKLITYSFGSGSRIFSIAILPKGSSLQQLPFVAKSEDSDACAVLVSTNLATGESTYIVIGDYSLLKVVA